MIRFIRESYRGYFVSLIFAGTSSRESIILLSNFLTLSFQERHLYKSHFHGTDRLDNYFRL